MFTARILVLRLRVAAGVFIAIGSVVKVSVILGIKVLLENVSQISLHMKKFFRSRTYL
jgi:hypothetical protein